MLDGKSHHNPSLQALADEGFTVFMLPSYRKLSLNNHSIDLPLNLFTSSVLEKPQQNRDNFWKKDLLTVNVGDEVAIKKFGSGRCTPLPPQYLSLVFDLICGVR